jgi:hypothetical protein
MLGEEPHRGTLVLSGGGRRAGFERRRGFDSVGLELAREEADDPRGFELERSFTRELESSPDQLHP